MSYKFNPFTKKPDYYETSSAGSVDEVARDNIVVLAWKLAIAEGLSVFNLEDGVVDEFEDETGVDTTASTNESYNSSDDYYSPTTDNDDGTGGTITHSGGYTIHTFTSNGTFNPGRERSVSYLLVGGGGAGGAGYYGGGGGGGGHLSGLSYLISLSNFSVTIGAGGVAGASIVGGSGGNTSLVNFTALGGGGGGQYQIAGGQNGGCGGGAAHYNYGTAGTGSQGYNGGSCSSPNFGAGGGGGGEIGDNGVLAAGNNAGGDGVSSSISGSAVTYAGGGGGGKDTGTGAGGAGGGGAGGKISGPVAATAGTDGLGGGGGGGGNNCVTGANGGTGVAIISYPTDEGEPANMTLISESSEAEEEPTEGRFLALVEPVDVITVNTDLLAYISNDDGSNYDQVTLEDEGYFDATKKILSGNVTLTDRSDKTMVQKIATANNKDLKVHAWGMLWK